VRWETADPAPPPGAAPEVLFPHIYGPVETAAVTEVRHARRDPAGAYLRFDRRPATAETLDLLPHPEGGWYAQTWASAISYTPDGYAGPRAAATLIYFLLTPGDESRWHTVRSDEIWLWHAGGPLTLLLGGDGDIPSAQPEVAGLGPERPHFVIPGGCWQSARPATGTEVLVSCVVAPGFDFADFAIHE
jgi:predicted cupin superfamily sugar epimerase